MLFRILILLIVLLVVPDVYMYFAYVRRWTSRWYLRLLTFLPSILLLVYMLLVLRMDDMTAEHQVTVGRFMIIFLLVTVPRFLFTVFDLIAMIGKGLYRRIVRIFAMTIALFSVIVLLYGYFIGRSHYIVKEQTLVFDNLPKAFDGYRILQFSDMHLGTFGDNHQQDVEAIVDLINSQKCDAIVFTGDLVNYQARETDGYRRNLSKLQAPDGVFAIMGNHDYSMYIKTLTPEMVRADIAELQRRERSYGWQLLLNENTVLHRGKDSIAIIGVENDGEFPFPSLGDLPKACKGLQGVMRNKNAKTPVNHTFSILLTHDPTHWRRNVLPETRIDLSLAGHTHAGQFKVFGWSPVALRYKEWSGIYTECSQVLNVNEGIGGVMFPFRFGAWPELTVITLRKGNR